MLLKKKPIAYYLKLLMSIEVLWKIQKKLYLKRKNTLMILNINTIIMEYGENL